MKYCPRCKETKENKEFNTSSSQSDGLQSYCRSCQNDYRKDAVKRNAPYIVRSRATKRKKWAENEEYREEQKAKSREFRTNTPEYFQEYRERNGEKLRAESRRYNKSEAGRKATRKYRHSEKGRMALRICDARRYNKERKLPHDFTLDDWQEILTVFGGRCAYCDEEVDKLEQDHFIPVAMEGGYERGNILPACPSCNRRKSDKSPLNFLGIRKYGEIMTRIHGA